MNVEDVPEDLVLTVGEIRSYGHCVSGQRQWCNGQGLDFRDILKNGVSARTLVETGEAFAIRVVEKAIEARVNGRR